MLEWEVELTKTTMAKKKTASKENSFTEILLYNTPNGKVKVEIYLQNETVWLSQQKIAELFGVDRTVVTKHLKNIFATKELEPNSVSAKIAHTAADGKTYSTQFYNLDAIISVGYRVNSSQATAFRIWATERLKEYIIKGFTMDDERLKKLSDTSRLFVTRIKTDVIYHCIEELSINISDTNSSVSVQDDLIVQLQDAESKKSNLISALLKQPLKSQGRLSTF